MRTRLLFGLLTALVALPLAIPTQATPAPQQGGTPGSSPTLQLSCPGEIQAQLTGTTCACAATLLGAANKAAAQLVNPGGGVACGRCTVGRCTRDASFSIGTTVTCGTKEGPNGETLYFVCYTAPPEGGIVGVVCDPCP